MRSRSRENALSAVSGTTRVELHAVTGLAFTHTAPFVRVVYEDVVARRHRHHGDRHHGSKNTTITAIELPEDEETPVLSRYRNEYTAQWNTQAIAHVPIDANWLELQVWNHFGDVAVFLGVTRISLDGLKKQASKETAEKDLTTTSSRKPMWYPLELSKEVERRRISNLSVQLSISFHDHDARTQRIQKQIAERRQKGRKSAPGNTEEEDGSHHAAQAPVVDPSFLFTEPSARIEWASIVAANVRRMFLQGDVEQLQVYYNDVLYGDLEKEIEDDDDVVVDETHAKAFKVCQLSGQYLDHCVALLDTRKHEYEEYYRSLHGIEKQRRREQKERMDQKRRLQKELNDVDLLVATYSKLLEAHGQQMPSSPSKKHEKHTALSSHDKDDSDWAATRSDAILASPHGKNGDVVSKKPAFLMTWEEREQARKLQKTLDKTQRIEDEKVRLQRLFNDRRAREQMEIGLMNLTQRRRHRLATTLQRAVRVFLKTRRVAKVIRSHRAAIRIQTRFRRFLCRKKWPCVRLELARHREVRLMERCDQEGKAMLLWEQERNRQLRRSAVVAMGVLSDGDDDDDPDERTTPPVQTLALVAMWKKLQRIFAMACQQGVSTGVLFSRLDRRGDGLVDRAEFRVGVRSFGVRIDRKMTRAVIALVRAKCEAPPRPLTLTLGQFIGGFNLPVVGDAEVTTAAGSPIQTSHAKAGETRDVAVVQKDGGPHRPSQRRRSDRDDDDSDAGSNSSDRETSLSIEQVASAVAQLRRRVLEAATDHVTAIGKSTTDYFAFREALTHVFEEFDVDGNGQLDVDELVDCMASIQFRVTQANIDILRECFVTDPSSSGVSIPEFISFALAGMRDSSATTFKPEEELGIVGFKLRDAILARIKLAQKQAETIEDAARLVFKRAYRTKAQRDCSRKDFVRVLASLRLVGFTASQLSRLVVRLDQDGDETISFDELLTWLRIRSATQSSTNDGSRSAARGVLQHLPSMVRVVAQDTAACIRRVLAELAELGGDASLTRKQRADRVTSLFQRIDRNGSKKINAQELEAFLSTVNLRDLRAVAQWEEQDTEDIHMPTNAARLAQQIIKLIDLNGNGVVTKEEWAGFIMNEPTTTTTTSSSGRVAIGRSGANYAVVEAVRQAMRDAFPDPTALLKWFHGISGVMAVQPGGSGKETKKVRTQELKKAVKAKCPFITPPDLDAAIQLLDADKSGWITEKELLEWQFPTRDIEELTVLITRAWTLESQSTQLRNLPQEQVMEALYQRFDRDGNGLIARKELRDGFASLQVTLSEEETLSLVDAFDLDHDGFWNKHDFEACVRKLLAMPSSDVDRPHDAIEEQDPDPLAGSGLYASDHEEADDDGSHSSAAYSLDGLSPLALSPVATTRGGVEYSEDFDE